MKPTYLLIGAAKCGTTTFCTLLGRHPDVFMHPAKELNFFCFDHVYERGWSWYEDQFRDVAGERAVGEGSPNYSKRKRNPAAPRRIARHLPDARLLYLVRHPLRRMESAWLHARRAGHRSWRSFSETVRRRPEYIDTSDYGRQLEPYRAHYPDERLLVLFFEDFVARPTAIMQEAFRFLGVDDTVVPQDTVRVTNPSLRRAAMTPAMRALRRLPGVRALRRWAPAAWQQIEGIGREELDQRPALDDETLELVRARLLEPSRRFLTRHGKPPDFWSI